MPLCVLNHTYLTLDQTKTIARSKMNLNGLLESLFWVFEKKLSIVVRGKALPHGWFTYRTYVRVYAIIGGQLFLSPGQIHLLSNGLKPWSLSAKFPINVLMLSHKLRQKASLRSIQFRFFVLGRVIIAFRKELISQQREISSLTFQPLQHI